MTAELGRIPVTLPPEGGVFNRLASLLGHHDFRIYVTEDSYIDVGAGSFPIVQRVSEVFGKGLLGTIGRFCEVNASARIQAHGAHDHDRPINMTFGSLPIMKLAFNQEDSLKPQAPFSIGSGVVISANALVLAGAEIGDGAVVGAGAIVTRPVEPFGIYGGAPARKIRSRPRCAPWWDFEVGYMLENRANLNELAKSDLPTHRYRIERPRFVLKAYGGNLHMAGFLDGDHIRSFDDAPASVTEYVVQAVRSETPYWVADCWSSS